MEPVQPIKGEEQQADLNALERMAQEEEGAQAAGGAVVVSLHDEAEEWAIMPQMIGGALAMAMPELGAIYSQQNCRAWGEAMAKVARKHGWEAGPLLGPEVGLFAASLPFILGTGAAIKARREAGAGGDKPTPGREPGKATADDKAGLDALGGVAVDPVKE